MSLFGHKEKEQLERIQNQLSPEQFEFLNLNERIAKARGELSSIENATRVARAQLDDTNRKLSNLKQQVIETDDDLLLQSFGMYTPHYRYSTSDEYKARLDQIRAYQKDLIKRGNAVFGSQTWTVNGNASQGNKMVKDMQKLLLRAFNAECDDAIEHVKFNNIDTCIKKITSSAESISKLGSIMNIFITVDYYNAKIDELRLMHEYQIKKQEEKESAKELRQKQREEAKVAKELEEAKHKLEKEQNHYQNAYERLLSQIDKAQSPEDRNNLIAKKEELEAQLEKIDSELKDVDYRSANQRAGYVYIISNIGAFGENVYKIGMTRRLEPMERVDELGDASVPFNFDVHAMIFTDDAPGLEAALHNAFANRKLNYINQRREFFNVSLDEIKAVVRKNYDKTVEFVDVAPAEQYRESLIMRNNSINRVPQGQFATKT